MAYQTGFIGWGGAYAPYFGVIFLVILVWSLFWKGLAFWHAARRGDWVWFLVFLVVNTIGILEIIYLFGFTKMTWRQMTDWHSIKKRLL